MSHNRNGIGDLSENITGMIVAIVVFAVVFIPIVYGLTTTTERIDVESINENPIGDLRLSYETYEEGQEALTKTYTLSVSGNDVSVSGDWSGTLSLDVGQIILGSDDYSVIIQNGQLLESSTGQAAAVTSLTITIADGEVNGHAYTFLYYPDGEGVYANFSSYQYDIQQTYAVGSFAGFTVASINNEVVGSNPLNLDATVQTEGDMTTGVVYAPGEDEPETPSGPEISIETYK